jgi:bifunctional non-homologous end joining protein LigD
MKFIEPMKAKLVEEPPPGDWLYELKFDGFRALALKQGDEVQLLSRNAKDLAGRFPEIAEAVQQLNSDSMILDGEIVAVDERGHSSFQLLQQLEMNLKRPPLFFYAFDLLTLEGRDLRALPLHERRKELERVLESPPELIRYSAAFDGGVHELLAKVKEMGLEGLIGKQPDSTYESGRRSGAWIKLKCLNEQEFVIGGYTPPEGARKHFGAILVGYYDGEAFKFAGKVGTGFNTALLKSLKTRFDQLERAECPFNNLPEKRAGRWSQGITPAEMRRCTWVEPELIAQVKFTEWTEDVKLRHPVFLGLREDKSPRSVVREVIGK